MGPPSDMAGSAVVVQTPGGTAMILRSVQGIRRDGFQGTAQTFGILKRGRISARTASINSRGSDLR
jgi:hypothetical protein